MSYSYDLVKAYNFIDLGESWKDLFSLEILKTGFSRRPRGRPCILGESYASYSGGILEVLLGD